MLALKSLVFFNNCFRPSHMVTSSLPNKGHYAIATYRIITFYVNIHYCGWKRAWDYHKHSLYGVFFSMPSNFIRNSKYKLPKTSKIHSSILNQLKTKFLRKDKYLECHTKVVRPHNKPQHCSDCSWSPIIKQKEHKVALVEWR